MGREPPLPLLDKPYTLAGGVRGRLGSGDSALPTACRGFCRRGSKALENQDSWRALEGEAEFLICLSVISK